MSYGTNPGFGDVWRDLLRQWEDLAYWLAEERHNLVTAEDVERNTMISRMLERGMSWSDIQTATGCGRATVAKIAARMRAAA